MDEMTTGVVDDPVTDSKKFEEQLSRLSQLQESGDSLTREEYVFYLNTLVLQDKRTPREVRITTEMEALASPQQREAAGRLVKAALHRLQIGESSEEDTAVARAVNAAGIEAWNNLESAGFSDTPHSFLFHSGDMPNYYQSTVEGKLQHITLPDGERWVSIKSLSEIIGVFGAYVSPLKLTMELRRQFGFSDATVQKVDGEAELFLGPNSVFCIFILTDLISMTSMATMWDLYKCIIDFQQQDTQPERSE